MWGGVSLHTVLAHISTSAHVLRDCRGRILLLSIYPELNFCVREFVRLKNVDTRRTQENTSFEDGAVFLRVPHVRSRKGFDS